MPLYGHEMDETVDPLEAGLGFAVKMGKDEFIGRDAILAKGEPARERVGLEVTGRGIVREHEPVFADGGAALAGLSAREIGALAGRWAAFDRAENPSPEDGEERLEGLKKAWSTRPMSAFAGACSNALARFRRRSGPNR